MIDMKNAQWKEFSMQEAVKRGNNKKVRCTFFRVNPNDRKQELENRCIIDMPKDLFYEYFQK